MGGRPSGPPGADAEGDVTACLEQSAAKIAANSAGSNHQYLHTVLLNISVL